MTLNEIMSPITVIFDWLRNRIFYLGEYPFTLWELFVWQLFAGIIIGFIVKVRG